MRLTPRFWRAEDDSSLRPGLVRHHLIKSREQPAPGRAIQEATDGQAIAGLVGPYRGLGLGGKDPHDRPRVEPKGAQMLLRHLDVTGVQEYIRRRSQPCRPS